MSILSVKSIFTLLIGGFISPSLVKNLEISSPFIANSAISSAVGTLPIFALDPSLTFRFAFLIAVCLLLSLVLPKSGVANSDVARPLPGRDAPLWDKGNGQEFGMVPMIRKIREGVLQVGNIMVNKKGGYVTVNGEVNMQEGLVEYLACGPRGKLHESVLKLDVNPFYLQIALLLIGLEPGEKPLMHQGQPGIPEGDPVEIWVTWADAEKKTIRHRAEDLIFNKAAKKTMKQTEWIFTGSQVIDGRFMAQVEHSIAATYHDPFAILDHLLPTGSDDRLYYVNSEIVPPKGTRVTFVVKSKKHPRSGR